MEHNSLSGGKPSSIDWEGSLPKSCYIFDNHNHALYFRTKYIFSLTHFGKLAVLHIDQHSDLTTAPASIPSLVKGGLGIQGQKENLEKRSHYTTQTCNVGNFIQPALQAGLISECIRIKNQYDLNHFTHSYQSQPKTLSPSTSSSEISGFHLQTSPYILDIDLDFRAPQMDTDINRSKQQLENLITHTQLVTIATSPYFLDQQRALELLKFLFT